jgi:predicted S18 family serine protease
LVLGRNGGKVEGIDFYGGKIMDRKEQNAVYWKKYYQENKDKLINGRKEKRANLSFEQKEEVNTKEKEYLRQYYVNNKEVFTARAKRYYEINKDIISERRRLKRLEGKSK